MNIAVAVFTRELRLAQHRRAELVMPLAFFIAAAGLFPLAVGPEPQQLRAIAPGVLWVCALLATLLAVPRLWAAEAADGALEAWLLSPHPLWWLVAAKTAGFWAAQLLPLVLLAPLLALIFGLPAAVLPVLLVTLLLGSWVLAQLGALAAALTLGLRAGAVLLVVLVLPLAVPVLVFGAGAVVAVESGLSASPHLSLLGACAVLATAFGPMAVAAALRIAHDG
jgi:heme exporter protein B